MLLRNFPQFAFCRLEVMLPQQRGTEQGSQPRVGGVIGEPAFAQIGRENGIPTFHEAECALERRRG